MTIDWIPLLTIVPALMIYFLLFYIFADLPYKRKKEREAFLRASSTSQKGVWPPAPTTYAEPQEVEPWAWCMVCHRASTMELVSDCGGVCGYADCSASLNEMIAWCDLKTRRNALPEQPEAGRIYANLLRIKEAVQKPDT